MILKPTKTKTTSAWPSQPKVKDFSDLWLECARRGLSSEPIIHSALQQLSVSYDFQCEQLINNRIRSSDIQDILNPDPYRKINPTRPGSVDGPIYLGKVKHSDLNWGIHPAALTEHVVLIGRTGGGKTTVIKSILCQLLERRTK